MICSEPHSHIMLSLHSLASSAGARRRLDADLGSKRVTALCRGLVGARAETARRCRLAACGRERDLMVEPLRSAQSRWRSGTRERGGCARARTGARPGWASPRSTSATQSAPGLWRPAVSPRAGGPPPSHSQVAPEAARGGAEKR
ncbi:Hypothetical protein GLP15_965 [Giardia lamblia P15]|uniref:Uncharacterized protein n=1 Tax=Giardia intestinalis (strain P15) TaxID=658858 RepID=E1EZ43_GIAIA|nr:Hypothetical protein GLP15_965 [Giardia lamblia P15]